MVRSSRSVLFQGHKMVRSSRSVLFQCHKMVRSSQSVLFQCHKMVRSSRSVLFQWMFVNGLLCPSYQDLFYIKTTRCKWNVFEQTKVCKLILNDVRYSYWWIETQLNQFCFKPFLLTDYIDNRKFSIYKPFLCFNNKCKPFTSRDKCN